MSDSLPQPFLGRILRAALCGLLFLGMGMGLSASGGSSSSGRAALEKLPPGLAPVLARSMADASPVDYRMTQAGTKHVSRNTAHGLKLAFSSEGMRIEGDGWNWGMALKAWGRDRLVPVPPARPSTSGARLEYRRGALTEWYLNSEMGLEQGFTVNAPPSPAGDSAGKLALELALMGDLRPGSCSPTHLSLVDPDRKQERVNYGGLCVFDADGKALPASFELSANQERLRILVEDRGARYPITIDPWIQSAVLTGSDISGKDGLGYSVAISGDTAVVGAPYDGVNGTGSGRAFVFVKPGAGSWADATETASLHPSDGAPGDQFGTAVGIDGDTIVVSTIMATVSGTAQAGAAYVFVKPGGGWSGALTESAKLVESVRLEKDWLGYAVAVRGNTVAVTQGDNVSGGDGNGAVYVFTKPGGGWAGTLTQDAILTINCGCTNAAMSRSVAISEDETIIAAGAANLGGSVSSQGAVCVFTKGAGWTNRSQDALLRHTSPQTQDQLGSSMSMSGDVIIAGAANNTKPGAVYVFVKPGGGWSGDLTQTAKLTESDSVDGDSFGYCVSISGDVVVAGNMRSKALYIFVKPGGGWANATETAQLQTTDYADYPYSYFGRSLSISGDTVIAGAGNFNSEQGAAYVFAKPLSGWANATQDARLTASDGSTGDQFGYSVAISGSTAVVGAYYHNLRKGAVYVYNRGASGWANASESATLTASDAVNGAQFGSAVAISGDQILVGAQGAMSGASAYVGKAYVFVRPGGGWSGTLTENAILSASDGAAYDYLGMSVALSSDTAVVGAGNSNTSRGAVYLFVKPGGGWSGSLTQTAKLTASDAADYDQLGYTQGLAISGGTVVAGAYGANNYRGKAYVFVKPVGAWVNATETAQLVASDGVDWDYLGASVAMSGDTVVLGASYASFDGSTYPGAAYIFQKPGGGWSGTVNQAAKLRASDGVDMDGFGISVAMSGDTIAVGASTAPVVATVPGPGAVYLFKKPGGGWADASETTKFTIAGGQTVDSFGGAVALEGGALLAGAYGVSSSSGKAYVFTGPRITGGAGIAAASLSLGGGLWTETADGSGDFQAYVPDDWSGSVVPSGTGYTFTPASRSYSNVTADQSSQDFTATAITYTISGNAGIAGATLSYTDGGAKTATADGSGAYSFTVSYNWSGTVVPSKSAYRFSPVSTTYTNVLANQGSQDYTATYDPTVVSLIAFTALAGVDRVELAWSTGSEVDTAGFHLWRAPRPDGIYTRVTPSLIPAAGIGVGGASYAWVDSDVFEGQTWYYKLEDLDTQGLSTLHGPISATVGASEILSFQATPASIFLGGASLLSWNISGTPGLSMAGFGTLTGSSLRVSPKVTTSYTLSTDQGDASLVTIDVKAFTLMDMAGLSKAWGSQSGDAAYDACYDLNLDGRVDDADVKGCLSAE